MTSQEKETLYTVRWLTRNKWGDPGSQTEALEVLGLLLGDGVQPSVETPPMDEPGQKLLWCPFAKTTGFQKSKTRGTYKGGYPKGAIVHFTAGRRSGVEAGIEEQVRNGYTYFVIDAQGNIGQNFPLDSWGYHAGESRYPGLNGTVSDELVGIEVQCAGKLENGKTWFGTAPEGMRTIVKQTENQEAGAYEPYTKAQEDSIEKLLRWLRSNNPAVFDYRFVLGHDEVSPGRKNDPGGSLSMTMPAFRKKLSGV